MDYLDTALDYLAEKEQRFAIILPHIPPMSYDPPGSIYQELLSSIVSQQLSTKVAGVIWKRFLEIFPDGDISPDRVRNTDVETLRAVGLSYAKASYVRNVAVYFSQSALDEEAWYHLEDDELMRRLTSIKGVGEWTVQMLQIFTLYKPDIWPVKDLGVQQGFARLYGFDSKDKSQTTFMQQEAVRWQPYRSAAALVLWKWKDLNCPGESLLTTLK